MIEKKLIDNDKVSTSAVFDVSRSRIIVKRGHEFIIRRIEEIAYFFTENRIVYSIDSAGNKFTVEHQNLSDLMVELNKKKFYRVNRKFIVNVNFIKRFLAYDEVKIIIEMLVQTPQDIIVSQPSTRSFREWIYNL